MADELQQQIDALNQKLNSFINILTGTLDLSSRNPEDMDRIRLLRDAVLYAVKMKGREGETERLLDRVRELLEMKGPTHSALIDELVKWYRLEAPTFNEAYAFIRGKIKAEGEAVKNKMAWLRMLIAALLGGIFTFLAAYAIWRLTGKA